MTYMRRVERPTEKTDALMQIIGHMKSISQLEEFKNVPSIHSLITRLGSFLQSLHLKVGGQKQASHFCVFLETPYFSRYFGFKTRLSGLVGTTTPSILVVNV